jgi:hypothetical protein
MLQLNNLWRLTRPRMEHITLLSHTRLLGTSPFTKGGSGQGLVLSFLFCFSQSASAS